MNARVSVAVFSLLLSFPAARAAQRGENKLFDVAPTTYGRDAKEAVTAVEQKCAVAMMSRIGPSPAQRAQCDKAIVAALDKPGVAYAAMARLDGAAGMMEWRLYDVIARSGDLSTIEKLIVALERIEERGMGAPRYYEKNTIANTLSRLTYASPKGSPHLAWRDWQKAHPNPSRGALLAARVAESKQTLAAAGHTDEHVDAIAFLVQEPSTRSDARPTLELLISQKGWTQDQHDRLASLQRSFKPAKDRDLRSPFQLETEDELPTAQLKKPRS